MGFLKHGFLHALPLMSALNDTSSAFPLHGPVLTLVCLSFLSPATTLWRGWCFYPHFTNDKTEAKVDQCHSRTPGKWLSRDPWPHSLHAKPGSCCAASTASEKHKMTALTEAFGPAGRLLGLRSRHPPPSVRSGGAVLRPAWEKSRELPRGRGKRGRSCKPAGEEFLFFS